MSTHSTQDPGGAATSPTPWRLCLNDEIIAADGICVARKHWDVHEENGTEARWRADAALICAAPEMLALLREDRQVRKETCGYVVAGDLCVDDPVCWEHRLRALLASLGEAAP